MNMQGVIDLEKQLEIEFLAAGCVEVPVFDRMLSAVAAAAFASSLYVITDDKKYDEVQTQMLALYDDLYEKTIGE